MVEAKIAITDAGHDLGEIRMELRLGHTEASGRRFDLKDRVARQRFDGVPAELQVGGCVIRLSRLSAWIKSGSQVYPFGRSTTAKAQMRWSAFRMSEKEVRIAGARFSSINTRLWAALEAGQQLAEYWNGVQRVPAWVALLN